MHATVPLEAGCVFRDREGTGELVALVTTQAAARTLRRQLQREGLGARVVVGEDPVLRDAMEDTIRRIGPLQGGPVGWSIRHTAPSSVETREQDPTCGRTVVTIVGHLAKESQFPQSYRTFERRLARDFPGTVTVRDEVSIFPTG